jgi:hypothetical protein
VTEARKAIVRIEGKREGLIVSIEVETEPEKAISAIAWLTGEAKADGWTDPTPQVVRGGGYGKPQKSRIDLDTEHKRVKLFPAYTLTAVRGDREASKAKTAEWKQEVAEALFQACGKRVEPKFVWDKDTPKNSHYWFGIYFAPVIWEMDYFKDWEKTPSALPPEALGHD